MRAIKLRVKFAKWNTVWSAANCHHWRHIFAILRTVTGDSEQILYPASYRDTWRIQTCFIAVFFLKSEKCQRYTVHILRTRNSNRRFFGKLMYASENVASQPGIEPRTSCTAGEYSMKRVIPPAVFSCHSGSQLCCYSTPPSHDGGSWLNVNRLRVEYAWRSDRLHVAVWELRITSGSPLCRGLTRAIYILLHRASENVASQPGIEPGTSCTAGEYSMKRAIRTAVFRCHSGSHLCCYIPIFTRKSTCFAIPLTKNVLFSQKFTFNFSQLQTLQSTFVVSLLRNTNISFPFLSLHSVWS
jgi:hypothetical protein